MGRHFETELDALKANLVSMGNLVDGQIDRACRALFSGNTGAADAVIAMDGEVDAFDSLIDRQCQKIFVTTQPVAVDLRLLMAALNINSQFERIGDIAVNIAERVSPLMGHGDFMERIRLSEMIRIARIMVRDSIDSFLHNDPEQARRVLEYDDIVDDLNRHTFRRLVLEMQSNSLLIEGGAHMIILSRHIERLADHATNIAEDVIFLVEARQVKHHAEEQPR